MMLGSTLNPQERVQVGLLKKEVNMQPEDQKPQPKAQVEEIKAPKGDKNVPKYTEVQWSKMRKSMQDRINELESDRNTLSVHVDTLESDNDALKATVVDLKKEIDDGIPEEAADVVKAYHKRQSDLALKEAEHKRNVSKFEARIAEIDKTDRQELAQSLSEKFGVDIDELLSQPNPDAMKAYAADNFDSTKIRVEEPPKKVETEEKLEAPLVPTSTNIQGGELNDAAFWKTYGESGFNPTPEDHKRAKGIKDKALKGG